jgi:hypothetical protein
MGADWTDRWGDDQPDDDPTGGERQYGMRPIGRQYGMRPIGRQYGMRPIGRQYGMRPIGRQYGMRPVRQYGMRPVRQYGMRPAEAEDNAGAGCLDPAEWSADIAELFCAMSATVRLGARVVYDVDDLLVPARFVSTNYLPPPEQTDAAVGDVRAGPFVKAAEAAAVEAAKIPLAQRTLRPREHELAAEVSVRNSLIRGVVRHPEVADALKQDIARALAVQADGAFLHGGGGDPAPAGITTYGYELSKTAGSALELAREILRSFRQDTAARFENPGWVFDPATLEELAQLPTAAAGTGANKNTSTLDETRLLQLDGVDGGVLLGYPFVVTRAATEATKSRIYFSADWTEAWIGTGRDLVSVEFSTGAGFTTDSTIIKAVTHHDFVVRRRHLFTFTKRRTP